MLSKLFTVLILFASFIATAQHVDTAHIKKTKPAEPKIDYTQLGTPMPPFLVITIDSVNAKTTAHKRKHWFKHKKSLIAKSNLLTEKDFISDANLIVMMFNPTCSHCIEETDLLKTNIHLFNKSKLLLLANKSMKDYLPEFYKQRNLKDFPKITIGLDSIGFINQAYLYRALPQINIYDKNHKLIKIYSGEAPIDSLKQYIE